MSRLREQWTRISREWAESIISPPQEWVNKRRPEELEIQRQERAANGDASASQPAREPSGCPSCGSSVLRFDDDWCCEACGDRTPDFQKYIRSLLTLEYPEAMRGFSGVTTEYLGVQKRLLRIAEQDRIRAARTVHKDPLWELISLYLWDKGPHAPAADIWDFVDHQGRNDLKDTLKNLAREKTTYAECYRSKDPDLKHKLRNIINPIRKEVKDAKKAQAHLCPPDIVAELAKMAHSLKVGPLWKTLPRQTE